MCYNTGQIYLLTTQRKLMGLGHIFGHASARSIPISRYHTPPLETTGGSSYRLSTFATLSLASEPPRTATLRNDRSIANSWLCSRVSAHEEPFLKGVEITHGRLVELKFEDPRVLENALGTSRLRQNDQTVL